MLNKNLILLALITSLSNSIIFGYTVRVINELNDQAFIHVKRGWINEVQGAVAPKSENTVDTKDAWCTDAIEIDPAHGNGKTIKFSPIKCNNFEVRVSGTKENPNLYIKDL